MPKSRIRIDGLPKSRQDFLALKKLGFSDARLAELTGQSESVVAGLRRALEVVPVYKRIDTCAAEFPSPTPYMYSAYEGTGFDEPECEVEPSDREQDPDPGRRPEPHRSGHRVRLLLRARRLCAVATPGIETIMVNCNPETVSTDYDTSDRLYFEPLTGEDVVEIVRAEQEKAVKGVIVQFGGQTPLKLASRAGSGGHSDPRHLARRHRPGRRPGAVPGVAEGSRAAATAERHRLQPEEEAVAIAERIGYPVVLRPSYVLGGRAMEIVHDEAGPAPLHQHRSEGFGREPGAGSTIYLRDAIEVDVDALLRR